MKCRHLLAVGEGYFEHMSKAGRYGFMLIAGGIACLVHAIFPCLFVNTASNIAMSVCDEVRHRNNKEYQ